MRFRDLTSLALRGLPSQPSIRRPSQATYIRTFHSIPIQVHTPSEEVARPQREDFSSPGATHFVGVLGDIASQRCKQRGGQDPQEPLIAFLDPSSDIQVEVRHATLFPGRELPGFPHPAPSPLGVSHTLRGLLLRALSQLYFMLQPLIGFPALTKRIAG